MPDVVMGQPLSRTEAILQNMLGANNVLEPPMSREEYLLLQLLDHIGPSGDYYTKEEIDNMISAIEQEIDWKESVATFADLATTYPDAEAGWTASVLADGRIYRYNGAAWIDIYGMIPLATSSVNGLMSSGKVIDLETVKTLLNGHSVASDVPANAKFTDTVYDDTAISGRVTVVEGLIDGHSVGKDVPSDAEFTDTVYDDTEVKEDISDLDTRVTDLENQEPDVNVSKTATGNPISITDAADAPIVSGEVTFEPVQNLHGYDKPWAGGAGKNKLPMTVDGIKAANTTGTWTGNEYIINNVTFTILTDNDGNVIGIRLNNTASSNIWFKLITQTDFEANSYKLNGLPSDFDAGVCFRWTNAQGLNARAYPGDDNTVTISGETKSNTRVDIQIPSGVSFSNQVAYPMIRLATETDPTFEPYSNICPIEGYTDCEAEVTGKNLCKWIDDKVITYSTGEINDNTSFKTTDFIPVKVGTKLYITSEQTGREKWWYDSNKNPYGEVGSGTGLKTSPIDGYFAMSASNTRTESTMVEYGQSASIFEPYQSTTYTIDLDGTRYGGKVDLVSVEMRVTHAMQTLDSNLNWVRGGGSSIPVGRAVYYFTEGLTGAKPCGDDNNINNIIMKSNVYDLSNKSYNSMRAETGFALGIGGTSAISTIGCNVSSTDVPDLTAFKTWLDSNPIQIYYPLATPFTVQLTPEQIRTLEGTNNISTNMTGMSLEYITQDYQPLVDLAEDNSGSSNDIVHLTQAEYDALPATKESDNKLYLITDTNGDGSQFQPVIYSFEEREIGVWTDGKPLYEKSVNFGTLPNATTKDLNHNISDIDTVFIAGGYAKNTTSGFVQQLNVPVPSNNQTDIQSQWYFGVTDSYIRCFTLTDRSAYDECIVTLQYTKTTDAHGSGTWTPQGVPTLHYSTDEHVIGTWIDGKPLYEKSWNVSIALPSESANTWVSTGIEIASINCDGIAGGELIDDQNQCIAGSIGFIQQKTYFAIYSQIGGRTITKVTIRYTKTTD